MLKKVNTLIFVIASSLCYFLPRVLVSFSCPMFILCAIKIMLLNQLTSLSYTKFGTLCRITVTIRLTVTDLEYFVMEVDFV